MDSLISACDDVLPNENFLPNIKSSGDLAGLNLTTIALGEVRCLTPRPGATCCNAMAASRQFLL